MNKITAKLQEFIKWFVFITTGILIVCAVNFSVFSDGEDIPDDTLWQILLAGLVTAVITVFFDLREIFDKRNSFFMLFLHYGFLDAAMILCGGWFGWMCFDLEGIVMMSVSVAGVYVFTFAVNYVLDRQQADAINRKLKEKYK